MVKEYIYEIPKTATISYFDKAEWNKNLTSEEKEKRDNFQELIWQDEILNSSQYGPGKSDFGSLYRRIKSDLSISKYSYPAYKISCDSDYYRGESYDYAGAIVYMLNGNAEWENKYGDACVVVGAKVSMWL